MGVKVSVTLPNGVALSVEGDADVPHGTLDHVVVELAPRLLAALAQGTPPGSGTPVRETPGNCAAPPPVTHTPTASRGTAGAEETPPHPTTPSPQGRQVGSEGLASPSSTGTEAKASRPTSEGEGAVVAPRPVGPWTAAMLEAVHDQLVAFCHGRDPGGAMRRIVVAAEAAHHILGQDAVSTAELQQLFELLEWPVPSDLSQTLRNAARRSFGWLERAPGREGYYRVTGKGRSEVLDEAKQ